MSAGDIAPSELRRPLRVPPHAIRGTNYWPSVALGIDVLLGWYPQTPKQYEPFSSGFFSAAHNDQELAQIAASGLNNIRLFSSFWSWLMDPAAYLQSLHAIAANCARHKISITYTVWSSTGSLGFAPVVALEPLLDSLVAGAPHPQVRDLLIKLVVGSAIEPSREAVVPAGEPWHGGALDEPGNPLFDRPLPAWPSALVACLARYLSDIGRFFAEDSVGRHVFQSYDLFNEPDAIYEHEKPRRNNLFEFIVLTHDMLRSVHPTADMTVGWAGVDLDEVELLQSRVAVAYLSSHLYRFDVDLARDVAWISGSAQAMGLPYVVSEFWERRLDPSRPFAARLGPQLDILGDAGVGWQMWGFLESNLFEQLDPSAPGIEIDGLVRPRRGQWRAKRTIKGLPLVTSWPSSPLKFDLNLPDPGDAAALRRWTRTL